MSSNLVAETKDLTILDYLYPLLKWRWFIFLFAIAGGLLGLAYAARQPLLYKAETTFLPRGVLNEKDETTRVIGAMGVSWSNRTPPEMVSYFSIVMRSGSLMESMLHRRFMSEASGTTETLLDILKIRGETEAERLLNGTIRLKGMLNVENKGGIVMILQVTAPETQLAADLANALTEEYLRQPKPDAEYQLAVEFAKSQLTSVTAELEQIEDKIVSSRNRFIDKGPGSDMMIAGLTRQQATLEAQRSLWYGEYTQALLRKNRFEAQNVEGIRVLEPAMLPLQPLNVATSKMGLVFLLLFAFLGSAFALVFEYFQNLRSEFEAHTFWVYCRAAKRDFMVMAGCFVVVIIVMIIFEYFF